MSGPPVVVDLGTHTIKAGRSGEPAPSHVVRNLIARPKLNRVSKRPSSDVYGSDALDARALRRLEYPMKRGIVCSHLVEDEGRVLSTVFDHLAVAPTDQPLLVTDACLNPEKNLGRICELLFEQLAVPAVSFALPPILSLYASGEDTGLVIDVGDSLTQGVAVYDGYHISTSTRRSEMGGSDVTRYLARHLRMAGVFCCHSAADLEDVAEMKENKDAMYVARNFRKEKLRQERVEIEAIVHELPDGVKVPVGPPARFQAPEGLFNPTFFGSEEMGVTELALDCLSACEIDLRTRLAKSVHLSGGSTQFRGFCDRFATELKDGLPRDRRVVLQAPAVRRYTAWIGGSILASMDSWKSDNLTTAQEFKDAGIRELKKSLL